MADVGHRYDAYQWELNGQMRIQNHRMATSEFQQSKLNAGECPLSGLYIFSYVLYDNISVIYWIIY